MKKILTSMMILAIFLFLMGMGEMGGSVPANKVPSPEKNFSVRVTDREGIQTSLSQFSQEGKVYLAGKRGNATVTIPFDKISQFQFQTSGGAEASVRVSLKGQESLEVKVDQRVKFFGKADFGTFQIEAKDLKSVHFLP